MLKKKDVHIRITDENLILLKKIALRDRIRVTQVLERAMENYFISKKLTTK